MDYLAAVFHITVTYFVLDKNMNMKNNIFYKQFQVFLTIII